MIGTIKIVIYLFSLMLAFFNTTGSTAHIVPNWKAGVARIQITPEESLWMGGYASRIHPSEGKLTELWTKALAIEDSRGERAVLITMDLIGLPKCMSDHIRGRLQRIHHLSRSQVILHASHTHSGPALKGNLRDVYPMDSLQWTKVDHFCNELENKIIWVAGKALKSMEPADIYAGSGLVRFQINRRNNREQNLSAQTELKGPNDYSVPVLKITDRRGKLLTITFGYTCHGTVLVIYKWNGDYMGYAQEELEKSHRGVTALFVQGAAGDQNPLPRRSVPLARQYGKELTCAVDRVLCEQMKPLDAVLRTAYSEVELSMEASPGKKELHEKIKTYTGFEQRWALRLYNKIGRGDTLETSYSYPLEVWRLGDLLIMALGGEPTIEYAIRLKQTFRQDHFILGYSKDVMAYIPTEAILYEGGYEGESS